MDEETTEETTEETVVNDSAPVEGGSAIEAKNAEKAEKPKKAEREKPVFRTELSEQVRKYWNAPENQGKIAAFLKRIGFAADKLTDEHRFNFAQMIEGQKAG